jgi:hypothetical protein
MNIVISWSLEEKYRFLRNFAPSGYQAPGGDPSRSARAPSMLTAAYYMLRDGVDYRDLGADHFDRRDKAKLAKRLVARLHDLGFTVELKAA